MFLYMLKEASVADGASDRLLEGSLITFFFEVWIYESISTTLAVIKGRTRIIATCW